MTRWDTDTARQRLQGTPFALLVNLERSRECGFHGPGTCPALLQQSDCGCERAQLDALDRRTGPGLADPACHALPGDAHGAAPRLTCPAAVGAAILHAAYYDWPWQCWPQLPGADLFLWRAVVGEPTLEESLALITAQMQRLTAFGDLSALSLAKIAGSVAQYVQYARASGCHTLRDADDAILARAWVHARIRTGAGYDLPQTPTLHNRRGALRVLFEIARSLDLADGDPTLDLELPKRVYNGFTPLTDDVIPRCRGASAATLTDTVQPAAWALAELSATTAELAVFAPCDLRPDARAVYLRGGAHTRPRVLAASEWQWQQLTARVRALRHRHGDQFDPTAAMLYRGRRDSRKDPSPVSATGQMLRAVLDRAGLTKQDGYTQTSITAWSGRHTFERTGSIEAVANHLGLRSLDRAAQLIGHTWGAELDTDATAAVLHTGWADHPEAPAPVGVRA